MLEHLVANGVRADEAIIAAVLTGIASACASKAEAVQLVEGMRRLDSQLGDACVNLVVQDGITDKEVRAEYDFRLTVLNPSS